MGDYINKLIVICDACCKVSNANQAGRAGRGDCAAGAVFLKHTKDLGNKVDEKGDYLGNLTVPEAEYNALIMALDHASSICRHQIEVWMDSELVVKHLTKEYKLRAVNLKPLYDRVKALEARFDSVSYFHHGRDQETAKAADHVAETTFRSVK